MIEFNCETLIHCLQNAKLPEVVHAPIYDKETLSTKVVGMSVNDCLKAIEQEIDILKQYKMHKEEAEIVEKHLKQLLEEEKKLDEKIKNKQSLLQNVHDELLDILKDRGLDTVDKLKDFFEAYDLNRENEMNKALEEYYSHKNRLI